VAPDRKPLIPKHDGVVATHKGAINNVKAFVASVHDGKPINNADQSVESNLTAILGRTAAYQQRMVTWDELLKSRERLHADLKLKW
jgi:myo-inositol 2-dehydrogenase/D-chiro-inositol 1-dehydrogenase